MLPKVKRLEPLSINCQPAVWTSRGALQAPRQQNAAALDFQQPVVGIVKHATACHSGLNFAVVGCTAIHISRCPTDFPLFLHPFPICRMSTPTADPSMCKG